MRWLWPLLFFGVTGWVAFYNDHHDDRKIIVPFVESLFPDLHGNPAGMGERSVEVLFGLSVLVLLFTIWEQVRAVLRRREAAADED
jgi:hypothetical protein